MVDSAGRSYKWKKPDNQKLHFETLATTTFVFHVRIIELETFIQTVPGKIQFSTIDIHKALRIDDNLNTMILEHDIIFIQLVHEFEHVCHAGTARGTYTQAQAEPLATLIEKLAYSFRCRIGQCYCHIYPPTLVCRPLD